MTLRNMASEIIDAIPPHMVLTSSSFLTLRRVEDGV